MEIRPERPADYRAVEHLTYDAFVAMQVVDEDAELLDGVRTGDEALLVRKLRRTGSFVPELDMVAEVDGKVVGNIMYTRSQVVAEDDQWETVTFGPVSVAPASQRRGIGSALVTTTLDAARAMGLRAVVIVGSPAYYRRLGFRPASDFGITLADGTTTRALLALPLYDGALEGVSGRFVDDPVFASLDPDESAAFNTTLELSRQPLPELWRLFPIELHEANPQYPLWYAQAAGRLGALLGDQIVRTSHIGSTSVPGLVAKPIVDILLEVDPAADPTLLVETLEADGWMLMAQTTTPVMRLDMCMGYTPTGFAKQVFHLHVVHPDDHDELWFADFLRTHRDVQDDYVALKRDLAHQHRHDRDTYTRAKTTFVRAIVHRARSQRA
ncbi:MAG: GNAT family N-acetyltransferase [Micrococcales bacterium]|nr:GNAT family N-acetyltransferase [Micrococcales bacterium]MCL2667955.1 GNAT family N-acetyltransferase [Micrococcales bacterium]